MAALEFGLDRLDARLAAREIAHVELEDGDAGGLREHLGDAVEFLQPQGGLFLWVRLTGKGGALADAGEPEKRYIPLLKVFTVFNLDQIDGLPDFHHQPVPVADWTGEVLPERIVGESGADIRHQGFRAFYSPPNDLIYLPDRQHFADAPSYYGTALHELCHWTGHGTRLGRQLGRDFSQALWPQAGEVAQRGV